MEHQEQVRVMVTQLYEAFGRQCNAVTHKVWIEALKKTAPDLLVETYQKIITGEYGHKLPSTAEFMDYYREIRKNKKIHKSIESNNQHVKHKHDLTKIRQILDKLTSNVPQKQEYHKALPRHCEENGRSFTITEDDQGRCYVRYR